VTEKKARKRNNPHPMSGKRTRASTPPPNRTPSSDDRAEYERKAFIEFVRAYREGEKHAGRLVDYKAILREASAQWNKKGWADRASAARRALAGK
jgi:hypothetical protein